MKKFIPQNHKEIEKTAIILMLLLFAILFSIIFFNWVIYLFALLIASPLFFMGFLLCLKKPGLYIDNDKFVFKRVLRKQIDIKDIAGLLILKSEIKTKHYYHYIKNRDKSFKYSIIYLKEFNPEFAKFNMGDIRFMSWGLHKEDAYFYTVYDEEVIELFKGKIPIIVCK